MTSRLVLLLAGLSAVTSSYIPPYYSGQPTTSRVVSLDPPDYRGEQSYRIDFTLEPQEESPSQGFVHRTWADFQKLDHLLTTHLINWGLDFPSEPTIENLDSYLQRLLTHPLVVSSNQFSDFLGINWSGKDLNFLQSLPDFMYVVIPPLYRAPEFPPEPPVYTSEMDAVTAEETPFEIWTYLMAFRSKEVIDDYLAFFNNFLNTCPDFSGASDDSDVLPPGHQLNIPLHYNKTFVHFLPRGYLNGHTVRISYLGKTKFNFLDEVKIEEWVRTLHDDKSPKRILDLGTGPGFSAFTYARVFPDAEVIGVDLAAPYIRFARMWNQIRNVSNVEFYAGNGEELSWLESESFDIINYAYVLHEMPAANAIKIINEMHRLLKPGGSMTGFEVPFPDSVIEREIMVNSNTWGYSWQDSDGPQGPEPYIEEYEFGTLLTESLVAAGFSDVEQIEYSYFDSLYVATK